VDLEVCGLVGVAGGSGEDGGGVGDSAWE
jgi:hypothetical protein